MTPMNTTAGKTTIGTPQQAAGDAQKVFTGLLVAAKNISLYPQGHVMTAKFAGKAHQALSSYLVSYGYLRIEIEKDRVLAQGEEIFTGPFEEGTLPFILFRDGIRWIEFIEGLEAEEVAEFLKILQQFSSLADEPEGDFATGIWGMKFPHIQYEVADFSSRTEGGWEGGGEGKGDKKSEISSFKPGSAVASPGRKNMDGRSDSLLPPIDPEETILTLQEQRQLQEMVSLEAATDYSAGVDVLMDGMLLCREKESFTVIVDVLLDEFRESLSRGEFDTALKIVWGLRKVAGKYQKQLPWAEDVCVNFFAKASAPESLSPVLGQWSRLENDEADTIIRIFECLDPSAVLTLALLPQGGYSRVKNQLLTDAIISLSERDSRPLETLLGEAGQELAESLFPVIMQLDIETSLRFLRRLAAHPNVSVRRRTVGEILRHPLALPGEIFKLIDDPDKTIRYLVLRYAASSGRQDAAEQFLTSYLVKTKFGKSDERFMIECFRALGKCGSSRSVPWLKETLLRRRWLPGKQRRARRKGAKVALEGLQIPEARQVLEAAGRVFYLPLRKIIRWAKRNIMKNKG